MITKCYVSSISIDIQNYDQVGALRISLKQKKNKIQYQFFTGKIFYYSSYFSLENIEESINNFKEKLILSKNSNQNIQKKLLQNPFSIYVYVTDDEIKYNQFLHREDKGKKNTFAFGI